MRLQELDEICPICSFDVNREIVKHTFPVGYNPSIDVSVMIPAYHCIPCDFGWYGSKAEPIIDDAAKAAMIKLKG